MFLEGVGGEKLGGLVDDDETVEFLVRESFPYFTRSTSSKVATALERS